ncbi:hypothetical protein LR007_03450 [candidate division NPL-UPA2 bacterium]|nr:hypothetical protein [candidate division NPL-UPA2 bacterium]
MKEEVRQAEVEEKEEAEKDTKTLEEESLTLKRDPFLLYPEKHGPGDVEEETVSWKEMGVEAVIYDPTGKAEALVMSGGVLWERR